MRMTGRADLIIMRSSLSANSALCFACDATELAWEKYPFWLFKGKNTETPPKTLKVMAKGQYLTNDQHFKDYISWEEF